jgi:alkylation response protein AidB-like acyl-CoA dehydrogenase
LEATIGRRKVYMDFEFTTRQKILKEEARELMEKEIIPIADEWDKNKLLHDAKRLKELFDKIIPLGYVGATLSKELGGYGLDHVTYGILLEELFRAYGSLGMITNLQNGLGNIHIFGTPEQKKKFLPPMLKGEMIVCGGITEPNVGSNPAEMETLATLDGDYYVVNGTKTWITNGTISDICFLVTQTKRGSGASGICHLIVERKVSPYEARELPKLGMRSCVAAELYFNNCRVPKENLLVPPGEGLKDILRAFETVRSLMALGSAGIAQAAIDASIRYAKQRRQFGKPIGSFQLVQEMIADMIVETEISRLLGFRALSKIDKGVRCDSEASMAKFYSVEAALRVTSMAIQIHGAMGLSEELPLERYFRDARTWTIPDGTTQIQKLIISRNALGINAFR